MSRGTVVRRGTPANRRRVHVYYPAVRRDRGIRHHRVNTAGRSGGCFCFRDCERESNAFNNNDCAPRGGGGPKPRCIRGCQPGSGFGVAEPVTGASRRSWRHVC
jgi:hypothetical protein